MKKFVERAGATNRFLALYPSRVAAGFVFAISTACMISPAAAQDSAFSEIRIEGNDRIEEATVLSHAAIAIGEELTAAELNAAYQRILDSGLFETVELQPEGDTLVIRVQEFPTINRVSIEGNRLLNDESLLGLLTSESRQVYSPATAEADASRIVQAYEQAGRLAASVEPAIIRRSNNRVDLVFEISEGQVVEVERISFVGNRNFSDRRLRRSLESKQAGFLRQIIGRDTFIADRIEFDRQALRDFYNSRGYVDFQILSATSELSRERDAYFVTFNVREGQQFRYGEITASSELPDVDADVFADEIKIRSGRIYNPVGVDQTLTRLERLATREGFDFIRIEPRVTRDDRDLELDIEFVVMRGERVFVERIEIEGNRTTLDRVVRRQFRTAEGDPFDPSRIRDASERIRALGYFSGAEVTTREGATPDRVIVDVDVEEAPTGSLGFGATYSHSGGGGLNARFSERNFLGRGQRLSAEFSTGNSTNTYGLDFTEPAFLGRDLALGFGANLRTSEGQANQTGTSRQGSLTPSVSFPLAENSRIALNYSLRRDIRDAGGDLLRARETGQGGAIYTSSAGYSYTYSTIDGGLNPDAGVLFRFGQDYAGIGGGVSYLRSEVFAVAETSSFREDVTLRAQFDGGVLTPVDGDTRWFDRYNLNSMRGFQAFGAGPRDVTYAPPNDPTVSGFMQSTNTVGGNFYALAKFDAEFPLGLPEEYGLRAGVFLDAGTVWGLDNPVVTCRPGCGQSATVEEYEIDDAFRLRSAVGVSLFWSTPIGPLRFNFSHALVKEEEDEEQGFDLTISTRF